MCLHAQLGVLVQELLSLELWREKVFPLMLENSTHPTSGFPAYLVVSTRHTSGNNKLCSLGTMPLL